MDKTTAIIKIRKTIEHLDDAEKLEVILDTLLWRMKFMSGDHIEDMVQDVGAYAALIDEPESEICPECHGSGMGYVGESKCRKCRGLGEVIYAEAE